MPESKKREEIQKQLQLSDVETARRIRRQLERKGDKVYRKVIQKYIEPLANTIYEEKLKDLPTIAKKIISKNDIAVFFELEEIKDRDAKLFFEDIVRFTENEKLEYVYKTNRKLKKLKESIYKKGLEHFASIISNATYHIEETQQKYKSQAPQIFALTIAPIDSTELAYLSISTFLRDEDDSMRDRESDEENDTEKKTPPNTMAKMVRKLGEAVEKQLKLEQESGEKLNQYQYKEMLVHLRKTKLPDDILLSVGIRLLGYLEDNDMSSRYKKDSDGKTVQYTDKYNRDEIPDTEYRTTTLVGYTESFETIVERIKERITETLSLHFNPMVIEPQPWQGAVGGGFVEPEGKHLLSLRKVVLPKEYEVFEKIVDSIPKTIYKAINSIQSTSFIINKQVHEYLEKRYQNLSDEKKRVMRIRSEDVKSEKDEYKNAKNSYNSLKSMNTINDRTLQPIKEIFLEARENYFDKLAAYSKQTKPLKDELHGIKSKLQVVKRLHNHGITFDDPIWFVWQMDFRGRIYPVQAHLNPQGDDVAKGLLKFAHKKSLTLKGLFWLRVHGANVYGKNGLDKLPFDKREQWTIDNEKEIADTVKSPFDSRLLNEADDPTMFYAFCCEYSEYLEDPENFKTSLPVGVDGSNNGLQHISALYHDMHSAQLVNVLPDEKGEPEDIYREVADHSRNRIVRERSIFESKKDKLLKNQEGLYLVEKENTEVLYENFLSDELLEILSSDMKSLEIVNMKDNIKKFRKKIAKHADKYIKLTNGNQRTKFVDFISAIYRKSQFKKSEFTRLFREKTDKFQEEREYLYRDSNELYIETVRSPHNFTDDKFLRLIDRSMVKPNVMTDSYGTGIRTKQNQIYAKLKDLHREEKLSFDRKYIRLLANYIGKINEESIDEISKASAEYMQWCKEAVSRIYNKKRNKTELIEWRTPIGLPVTQVKFKKVPGKVIETSYGQDKVSIQNQQDSNDIDTRRQGSGLAPNFVHSLDSTHLFMSINAAEEAGVKSFMTIHDSFASHACDVDKLLNALKSQFVKLHSEPIMENLKIELEGRFGVELPSIDYVNDNFDIKQVDKSDYFFA